MQIYNADFDAANSSLNKDPRWVAVVDFDGAGNKHYFTSHSDTLLPAGLLASEYTHSVLRIKSLSSQTLVVKDSLSKIGAISFDLLDVDKAITEIFQTQLDVGNGLNKKTVEIYKGYSQFTDFDTQYELI